MVMCACAAMSTFSKTKVDRDLISAADAEPMFRAVLKTCVWCLSELRATAELRAAAEAKEKLGDGSSNRKNYEEDFLHGIVTDILEHAASASWGLAVVLAREKYYSGLVEDLAWVKELKAVLFNDDDRIDECVKIAISGAFSVLSFDLFTEMSEYDKTLEQLLVYVQKKVKNESPTRTCYSLLENLNYLTYARSERMWELFSFGENAGPSVLLGFMEYNLGNNDMMKPLSSSLLYVVSDMHQDWEEERLKFVVRILAKNKNQMVLNYTASALWCLARNKHNRRLMGKLYCVQGLLKILKGNR